MPGSVDASGLRRLHSGMVASVVRNPNALVWFTHLRDKDEYTALHSMRVAILALAFGRHLDLTIPKLNILGVGALLHDIGKVKISNDIRQKPECLTDREFDIVKSHVPEGVKILASARDLPMAAIEVAACHHERYQGGGYARGLSGARIGLFGLMAALSLPMMPSQVTGPTPSPSRPTRPWIGPTPCATRNITAVSSTGSSRASAPLLWAASWN